MNNEWSCSHCGSLNSASSLICPVCGYERINESYLNCLVIYSIQEEDVYISDSEDDLEHIPLLQADEQQMYPRDRARGTMSDEEAQELRSQLLRILELYDSERRRQAAQSGNEAINDNTTNLPVPRSRRVVSISISNILSNGSSGIH